MKKDIFDKEISDKIAHYERQPSPDAWNKVASRLPQKRNTIVLIWAKYLAASSIIILLGFGMWSKFMVEDPISDTQEKAGVFVPKPSVILGRKHEVDFSTKETVEMVLLRNTKEVIIPKSLEEKEDQKPITVQVIENNMLADNTDTLTNNGLLGVVNALKEDEVIVLNVLEDTMKEEEPLIELTRAETGLKRFWGHLKKFKKGEDIEWNTPSKKLVKLFAKTDAKIISTRERFIRQEE